MNIEWLHGEVEARCPVCRESAPQAEVLEIDHVLKDWEPVTLLRCACGAAFLSRLDTPDYASLGSHGNDYHVEQAFGFDPLAPILLRLPADSVRRCLDVGCAFGLMLDFARFAFGCAVLGVDPSALAPAGAEALDLPILHTYLGAALDLGPDPFDLVLCSEVIEHVADPHALLPVIADRLSPRGLLILTTPNVEAVRPEAAAGDLVRTLSPGLHLVLYDCAALTRVLAAAGFSAVRIEVSTTTLIAFASRSAETLHRIAPAGVDRSPLLRYFDSRANSTPPRSALASGFAYRHFRDCLNAGDHAAAEASRTRLARLYQQRYGFDLDDPADAAARGTDSFNLPGALYLSALLELNGRHSPERAAARFAAAITAAEAIPARFPTAVLDGETEAFLLRSRVLLPAALAAFDADRALAALHALGERAKGGGIPRDAWEEAWYRTFVRLVHSGAYAAAEALVPAVVTQLEPRASAAPDGRDLGVVELEALYCLAMLDLQQGRSAMAAERFGDLRRRVEESAGRDAAALLLWPAIYHQGLALQAAGRHAAARRILASVAAAEPRPGLPEVPPPLIAAARLALGSPAPLESTSS